MPDPEVAPPLTIRVPGTLAGVREALDAFEAYRTRLAVPDDDAWAVHIALDEVLSNVVHHAYAGRSDGSIDITATLTASSLVASVSDDGPGYDPLTAPEPDTTLPLEEREIGGLGIHIVKHLMQRVEYSRQANRNTLVFVRVLAAAGGPGKD